MVGSKQHVLWGAMAAGLARSLGDWLQFCQLPKDIQRERVTGMRGSIVMIIDILEAIPEQWTTSFSFLDGIFHEDRDYHCSQRLL